MTDNRLIPLMGSTPVDKPCPDVLTAQLTETTLDPHGDRASAAGQGALAATSRV